MSTPIRAVSGETTPAMIDLMSPLPGLSPVAGKSVVAKFDGGQLSSDGGIWSCVRSNNAFASPIAWPPALKIRGRLTRSRTASPTLFVFDY